MRAPKNLSISLVVASLATPCFAQGRNLVETSGCSLALKQRYGEQATFKLVSRRTSRAGLKLKVAVRSSPDASGQWQVRYAFCQINRGNEGEVTIEDANPGPTVRPE